MIREQSSGQRLAECCDVVSQCLDVLSVGSALDQDETFGGLDNVAVVVHVVAGAVSVKLDASVEVEDAHVADTDSRR